MSGQQLPVLIQARWLKLISEKVTTESITGHLRRFLLRHPTVIGVVARDYFAVATVFTSANALSELNSREYLFLLQIYALSAVAVPRVRALHRQDA